MMFTFDERTNYCKVSRSWNTERRLRDKNYDGGRSIEDEMYIATRYVSSPKSGISKYNYIQN